MRSFRHPAVGKEWKGSGEVRRRERKKGEGNGGGARGRERHPPLSQNSGYGLGPQDVVCCVT